MTKVFQSVYPYTQELLAEYPLLSDAQTRSTVARANDAFGHWKKKSYHERAEIMNQVTIILRRDQKILATLITREMGKVFAEAMAEIEKCAGTAAYYAQHAAEFLRDEPLPSGYAKSFVSFEPMGVVLGIMPWNFPFWQVFRYAIPTLMAGNTTILKHAPNVCGCALALEKIFLEAGAEAGVFSALVIDTPAVEKIIASRQIIGVTLTGSERAGSAVASISGKEIKKSVMELGGSDAFIVLPDADMKKAASVALQSRMQNAGQSCIAAKRFILVKNAEADFMQEFTAQLKALHQGDPFNAGVQTGPMARLDLVAALVSQMNGSVSSGARLVYGGETTGCNFKPALLSNVSKGMPVFDEETFGPLAAVTIAEDEMDAVRLANDSHYGLAGSVWTRDVEKGVALARLLETGAVYINTLVKSDARLPFGGIKKSGYGRELGKMGILEFVNAKTIVADAE